MNKHIEYDPRAHASRVPVIDQSNYERREDRHATSHLLFQVACVFVSFAMIAHVVACVIDMMPA